MKLSLDGLIAHLVGFLLTFSFFFLLRSHIFIANFLLVSSLLLVQATNGVLLRHGGVQYEAGANVYVGAFEVIELALAGVPGTVGHLLVEVEGQIQAAQISLKIPFRLRPCHLGFDETPLMDNNVSFASTWFTKQTHFTLINYDFHQFHFILNKAQKLIFE